MYLLLFFFKDLLLFSRFWFKNLSIVLSRIICALVLLKSIMLRVKPGFPRASWSWMFFDFWSIINLFGSGLIGLLEVLQFFFWYDPSLIHNFDDNHLEITKQKFFFKNFYGRAFLAKMFRKYIMKLALSVPIFINSFTLNVLSLIEKLWWNIL